MTAFLPDLILLAAGIAILASEVFRVGSGRSDTSVPYHLDDDRTTGLFALRQVQQSTPQGGDVP